jgi:hypothetical protein
MKRPHIPLKIQLEVALRQLGLDPKHVRLDHHPPLQQRIHYDVLGGKIIYDPDANNPRYMQWLSTEAHAEKTTGRRGTSKLSKRGGDLSEIAKTKRLERSQKEFRDRLLNKGEAEAEPRKRRAWPKRKFPAKRNVT